MKHTVFLVQKGVSSPTHPVSGKSLKHYGAATQSPRHGGVIFKMSAEEYRSAAHDLIGNTAPGQQWVPEFESDATPQVMSRGKCCIPAGCKEGPGGRPAEADYIWETNLYCAGHAPLNATPLHENAPPVYSASEKGPTQPESPDVLPKVVEKGVGGQLVERDGHTAPEHMPPPVVGAESEAPARLPGNVEKPVPIPSFPKKTAPAPQPSEAAPAASESAPSTPPPATTAKDLVKSVVAESIVEMKTELLGEIRGLIAELRSPAETERDPAPSKNGKGENKKSAKKPAAKSAEMAALRKEARALNINTFQMSREKIETAIAEKKKGGGADDEIKF